MRLLWVSQLHSPDIGGIERLAELLLPRFAAAGVTPVVLCSHGAHRAPDREELDGVEVHRVRAVAAVRSKEPRLVLDVGRRVAEVLARADPDLVHQHDVSSTSWFVDRAQRTARRPTVLTLHNVVDSRAANVRSAVASAGRLVCLSQAMRREVLGVDPTASSRLEVIPNGVVDPGPSVAPPTRPVVLVPARLTAPKRVAGAVAAVAALVDRHPDVRLVVAGDGVERDAIRAQVDALGLTDRTDLLGSVDPASMGVLYRQASVVVLSSLKEGMPLALLEAAMHGRPVVATAVGGVAEAVVDGETGLLVEPQDDEALAQAIDRVLGDTALAARLGTAARDRALAGFDVERCAAAHLDLYRRFVGA